MVVGSVWSNPPEPRVVTSASLGVASSVASRIASIGFQVGLAQVAAVLRLTVQLKPNLGRLLDGVAPGFGDVFEVFGEGRAHVGAGLEGIGAGFRASDGDL